MLNISVRSDLKQVAARFAVDTQRTVDAATVRALNRTATSVRAEANRRIRGRYNIKASVVRKQMRIINASRARLYSEVIASGRPIPLIEFSATWSRRRPGASVRVTKERKTIPHTFIAKMPTGHVGVFERRGQKRLPIRELFSISLPTAFTNREVMSAVQRVARQRFGIELARELKFRTGAANG